MKLLAVLGVLAACAVVIHGHGRSRTGQFHRLSSSRRFLERRPTGRPVFVSQGLGFSRFFSGFRRLAGRRPTGRPMMGNRRSGRFRAGNSRNRLMSGRPTGRPMMGNRGNGFRRLNSQRMFRNRSNSRRLSRGFSGRRMVVFG